MIIISLWIIFLCFFIFSYLGYFGYLLLQAKKPWNLNINVQWNPSVSILISVHNVENIITSKLENLSELSYPKNKLQIIVVDDASTDKTLKKINEFIDKNSDLHIDVVKQHSWKGKAKALNRGLKKAKYDILILTDADALLPKNIITNAMQYFFDPSIGALSGRYVPLNTATNWVTESEDTYLNLMSLVRLGESKIHSTIRFEGSFCAFKKKAFDEFDEDTGADDSGTALKIIQNGYRAIFIPEIHAYGEVSNKIGSKIRIKIRRATHLTALWFKCMNILLEGKMKLPKKLILPEIFISLINPVIFFSLTLLTLLLFIQHPSIVLPILLVFTVAMFMPLMRNYTMQGILYQFILMYSIYLHLVNKKFIRWI